MMGELKICKTAKKVVDLINSEWPINPLKTAELLRDKGNVKTLSSKYLYHFKKLKRIGMIELKKLGNTYVAWPRYIERTREMERKKRLVFTLALPMLIQIGTLLMGINQLCDCSSILL